MSEKIKQYIFDQGNFLPDRKLYAENLKVLSKPFPSTRLDFFPRLSEATRGLRAHEFTILCGSTGVGKTTLISNFSASLLTQGVPHFVASVETGHLDFITRIMSAISTEDWNTGDEVPIEKLKDFTAKNIQFFRNEKLILSLYENRFSVQKLMNDIALAYEKFGCKIAIVDNLNFFLDVTRSSEQIIEMDRVIHDLIIFCKNVPVHIIMVMHPKKTEESYVKSEFDIKGSSTAVQEAHNVFLFNRAHKDLENTLLKDTTVLPHQTRQYTSQDLWFMREIKIAKMRRRGKSVGRRILLKSKNGVRYEEDIVL